MSANHSWETWYFELCPLDGDNETQRRFSVVYGCMFSFTLVVHIRGMEMYLTILGDIVYMHCKGTKDNCILLFSSVICSN